MANAWKLFDQGDKLAARQAAEAVLASNPSAAEQQQARDLMERLRIPPFALMMALIMGIVAIALTLISRRFS